MSEKYSFWVTLRPQSDCCCQGEAKVCIFDFKTTWSEFKKLSQNAVMRGKAKLRTYNLKKLHILRVSPKQLCASAHLGCAREAGTSW